MGWFFDPGFIQNVQRVAADIENPSMESIDSVLFALREMGYIRVSGTCEHCVPAQDYAAILARHNALVEAVHKAMDRIVDCDKKQTNDQLIADVAYLKRLASDHFKTSVDCGNRAFAAEQKYDALVEAVAWEREFDETLVWLVQTGRYPRDMAGKYDLANERECARAEVDRLISGTPAPETQEKPC